jgi:hypothetical protein
MEATAWLGGRGGPAVPPRWGHGGKWSALCLTLWEQLVDNHRGVRPRRKENGEVLVDGQRRWAWAASFAGESRSVEKTVESLSAHTPLTIDSQSHRQAL